MRCDKIYMVVLSILISSLHNVIMVIGFTTHVHYIFILILQQRQINNIYTNGKLFSLSKLTTPSDLDNCEEVEVVALFLY